MQVPLILVERATYTMGSIVTIKAYCEDEQLCHRAIDQAFQSMKEIDRMMSVFDPASQVSLLNREAARREIDVDKQVIDILHKARQFHSITAGAFDITIEPLMQLFGFRTDNRIQSYPNDRQVLETLEGVGLDRILSDERSCSISFSHPKTKIDFGGIAVGYALDKAVTVLRSHGIDSAILNHSGDIYAIGTPPGEAGWEIGITDPLNPYTTITSIRIADQALSTSGNYNTRTQIGTQTIGHLLDPRTGRTAQGFLSGTAIAPSAVEADALSTGIFVVGPERAKSIVRSSPDYRFLGVAPGADGGEQMIQY